MQGRCGLRGIEDGGDETVSMRRLHTDSDNIWNDDESEILDPSSGDQRTRGHGHVPHH
jgi:hypothetical protein